MARWDKPNNHHSGWKYFGIEDLGESILPAKIFHYRYDEDNDSSDVVIAYTI